MAIATLPECRRPTCHNEVAIGKNGEPLKDCETHRDKRPSAKARKAAAAALTERNEAISDGIREADDLNAAAQAEVSGIARPPFFADGTGQIENLSSVAGDKARFGAPSPAPKPSARQKANDAISARLAGQKQIIENAGSRNGPTKAEAGIVPEPVVALRADRNQVIVTLTATGSTDAQSKAKSAARAAGHKITGVDSISGGAKGSRKPSEWKVTLGLRATKAAAKTAIKAALATPLGTPEREVAAENAVAVLREAADAGELKVRTRFHSGSGKYLAEAKVAGKTIYRYGADADAATQKMREHLASLG